MYRNYLSASIIAMFLTACASSSNEKFITNENLILNMPFPNGEWVNSYNSDAESVWKKKSSKENVSVSISLGKVTYPYAKRSYSDDLGKRLCPEYKSVIDNEDKTNGYYSLIWSTTCERNNKYVYIMIKVITGNDSTYSVSKVWYSRPTKSDYDLWLEYLKSVSVCDSRSDAHRCPEGMVKIN